jgi:hypothetical protein
MWSWWVKTKDTTQVMYIAKLKDGPKRATKFWKGFLKWYDGGEENRPIQKGFWCCNVFLISKYQLPLFIWRDSWRFSFSLSLFSILFSLFFYAPSLWGLDDFDDIWGERQPSKIIFKLHGMVWLIHDYEDMGVVDISVVDAYSEMELCTPIFLGEASK